MRWVATLVGGFGMAALGAGLALDPEVRADEGVLTVAAGAVAALLFGAGGVLAAVGVSRDRGVLLSPAGVMVGYGGRSAFLAWEHVERVAARDLGPGVHVILLVADHPAHVVVARNALSRALTRLHPSSAGDVSILGFRLGVDPVVAYAAIRYYRRRAEARAELADGRAVERVARRDLR